MRAVKALCLFLALLLLPSRVPAASEESVSVSAEAAILIEARSGRVLWERNADARLPQASTTKIMTALLAIEAGGLDRTVTISENAAGAEGSSLYLKAGETLPLRELVYGLMLQSGNDAAIAIAESVAGSVASFVSRMNEKARLLRLNATHFCNPNGLHDPDHYTSARDLAALSAYAMQNETFFEVVRTQYRAAEDCSTPRTFKNKNKLLWQYDGCCGLKTGYTKAAGKCLSFAAERKDMLLIGVVLNAPKMWDDAKALFDYGFSSFEMRALAEAGAPYTANVLRGEKKTLPAAPKSGILYPIRSDGSETLSTSVTFYETVTAPVFAGQQLGTIRVLLSDAPLLEVPIVALESVPRRTYGSVLAGVLRGARSDSSA